MKSVSSDNVQSLWDYMTKKYRSNVIYKASSDEMKLIASILNAFEVVDYKKFMSQFCTTIGNNIYLSTNYHKILEVDQVALCVHEHVHVRQFKEDPTSMLKYAVDRSKRTLYECEAYRSNMEILFYLTGKHPSPTEYANLLKYYNVNKKDITFAKEYLTKSAAIIDKGGVVTLESKVAIAWMNKNLPKIIQAKVIL